MSFCIELDQVKPVNDAVDGRDYDVDGILRNRVQVVARRQRYSGFARCGLDTDTGNKPSKALIEGEVFSIKTILYRPHSGVVEFEIEGRALDGFAEMAEALEDAKPKINMTKALPTENAMYLWASESFGEMFSTYVFMYPHGPRVARNGDLAYCKDIGGYWAKVDESMFEFEGE